MPVTSPAAPPNMASPEPSHTQSDFLQEGPDMTEGCEHWLVQRTINHRYWACVDCELEFRPVERAPASTTEIVPRALGRVGLEER
jgi:hypothetical protein